MHPKAVCPLAAALFIGALAPPGMATTRLITEGEALVEVRRPAEVVPLLMPPPPTANQALPTLQDGHVCGPLQAALLRSLGNEKAAWSVSVVDPRGALIADVNGGQPRVPASNQKLITTAFALDRLGPDFRLKTQLLRRPDGSMELIGQGDPDLNLAGVQRLAMAALGQGGARGTTGSHVQVLLREEPQQHWWPRDWHPADRGEAYGAPITRLALTSNALRNAVSNPAARFQTLLQREIERQGGKVQLRVQRHSNLEPATDAVVLHEETSAPMHALLSLANTESHNFTAEVLLREAARQWNVSEASRAAVHWMRAQNLPMVGLRISDGSGLSRANRVTSRTLAALLLRMSQHPLSAYFQASMAIAGQRGTLRDDFRGTRFEGRFYGKTGTLTGVRTVSGILQTTNGLRFVSLLSNGAPTPNATIKQVLASIQQFSPCPSST
ncbi:MAG: D-alanyl-D-alanine carboxypeptidase/D-alanyl-D-alanine endopeptidase [Synechococcus sp.]